jgi:hypothetical protein
MALLEINLEKPALVEEYQYPGETTVGETEPGEPSPGDASSGGGGGWKGKAVGLLAVLAGAAVLAWKLKGRSGTEQADFEEFETHESEMQETESEEYEHGPEPEIGSDEGGGAARKVASALGLVVALAGVAAALRKVRR